MSIVLAFLQISTNKPFEQLWVFCHHYCKHLKHHNFIGHVDEFQHQRRHADTQNGESNAEDQRHGNGGVNGVADVVIFLRTVVLADDHAGTGRKTHEKADEHIYDGTYRTDGGIQNADQYWAKETAAWEAKWPQVLIDAGLN